MSTVTRVAVATGSGHVHSPEPALSMSLEILLVPFTQSTMLVEVCVWNFAPHRQSEIAHACIEKKKKTRDSTDRASEHGRGKPSTDLRRSSFLSMTEGMQFHNFVARGRGEGCS